MLQIIASIVLASLFIPAGFNFLTFQPVDFSYAPLNQEQISGPQRIINSSLGIKTTASNVLIVDSQSERILYSKNQTAVAPIASLTKLITALTFLDHNPGWEKTVIIEPDDQREGGLVKLLSGEEVGVSDLFYLTLVSSTNEAAVALARSTGLEDFVAEMNKKAFALGLIDSNFVEPTGLSPQNIASPADLVLLAKAAFGQPEISAALKTGEYNFKIKNNGRVVNAVATDKILGSFIDQGQYKIVGAKTGFLEEAGYCFLLQVERQDGTSIVLVLLGAADQESRWQEAKGLVDWVFNNYHWVGLPLLQ